jgi:hypothetical protein
MDLHRRSPERAQLIRRLEEARPFYRALRFHAHPDHAMLDDWRVGSLGDRDTRAISAHLAFCDACYDLVHPRRCR